MRTILLVFALIGAVVGAQAGECFQSYGQAREVHQSGHITWNHHQRNHKGELCYYAKASKLERKVMPIDSRKDTTPPPRPPEIRAVNAAPPALVMPLAWPKPRVIISPWIGDFEWMVGLPEYTGRVGQVFAQIGF